MALAHRELLDPKDLRDQVVFYKPKGCDRCAKTGYQGRKGIYEIYMINAEMREIIYRHGGDIAKLKEVVAKSGMWDLRASGWRKVLAGMTTVEEILSITSAEE